MPDNEGVADANPEPTGGDAGAPTPKKWYKTATGRTIGVVATAFLAALGLFVTGVFNKLIFDPATDLLGGAPLNVAVTRIKDCPYGYIIPGAVSGATNPPDSDTNPDAFDKWARSLGGADSEFTQLRVTVTGTGDTPVVIQNVRLEVVARDELISGFAIKRACGDLLQARYLSYDLDRKPPALTASKDTRYEIDGPPPGEKAEPVRFPYVVDSKSPEPYEIFAFTQACNCAWRIHIEWTAGDRTGDVVVDDSGAPFRTHKVEGYAVYDPTLPPISGR